MATRNAELMRNARTSLEGNWGLAIGTCLVYVIALSATQLVPLSIFVLAGPMLLGLYLFVLTISRGGEPRLEQLFDGFKNFSNSMVAYLLVMLYVFLWTLLLIIPGIIAALSYSQTMFIIADEPNLRPSEALDKSKAMMDGFKTKLFGMHLRFFGWSILCLFTFGIGFLFLFPYMYVSLAKFYDDVRAEYEGGGSEIDSGSTYTPPVPPMSKVSDRATEPATSSTQPSSSDSSGSAPKEEPKKGYDYEK